MRGEISLAGRWRYGGGEHCRDLVPWIKGVLDESGIQLQELAAVSVACGPGSFTGLRIGLATAKGLAMALGCALVGVPTLEAMASLAAGAGGIVCPVLPSRRGEVYAACYQWQDGNLKLLTPYWVGPPEKLDELLPEVEPVVLVGEASQTCAGILASLSREARLLPVPRNYPLALAVAWLGWQKFIRGEVDGPGLRAIYLSQGNFRQIR